MKLVQHLLHLREGGLIAEYCCLVERAWIQTHGSKDTCVTRTNYSPEERKAIEEQIAIWRQAQIVEPVPGGATAGVVFNSLLTVRKKDGTFRVCLDPRPLNKATILDESPSGQNIGSSRYLGQLVFENVSQDFKLI